LGREGAVRETTGLGTMPRTCMMATLLWACTGSRRPEGGERAQVRIIGIGGDRNGVVQKEHLGEGGAYIIMHRVIVPYLGCTKTQKSQHAVAQCLAYSDDH